MHAHWRAVVLLVAPVFALLASPAGAATPIARGDPSTVELQEAPSTGPAFANGGVAWVELAPRKGLVLRFAGPGRPAATVRFLPGPPGSQDTQTLKVFGAPDRFGLVHTIDKTACCTLGLTPLHAWDDVLVGPAEGPHEVVQHCDRDFPVNIDPPLIAVDRGAFAIRDYDCVGKFPGGPTRVAVRTESGSMTVDPGGRVEKIALAGRFLAVEHSYGVTVFDLEAGAELYSAPVGVPDAMDLQPDGKLALLHSGGQRNDLPQPERCTNTTSVVSWFSPEDQGAHRLEARPCGRRLQMAEDRIFFERALTKELTQLVAVGLDGSERPVAYFDAWHRRIGDWDVDGHRVAFAQRDCTGAYVMVEDLALEGPAVRNQSRGCGLSLQPPERVTRNGRIPVGFRCALPCQRPFVRVDLRGVRSRGRRPRKPFLLSRQLPVPPVDQPTVKQVRPKRLRGRVCKESSLCSQQREAIRAFRRLVANGRPIRLEVEVRATFGGSPDPVYPRTLNGIAHHERARVVVRAARGG